MTTVSGVARPTFLGRAKCLILDEQTVLCFGYRLSKHNITSYSKSLGEAMAP